MCICVTKKEIEISSPNPNPYSPKKMISLHLNLLQILLLVGVATTTISGVRSAPILGLDSFLNQQSTVDPQGNNDSFPSLPSSVKRSLSQHHHLHTPTLISSLLSLSTPVSLHLRLVGPSFPPDSSSLLLHFLSASLPNSHFHTVHPHDHLNSHMLSISHNLHLHVSHAPSLSSLLSSHLSSQISSSTPSLRSSLLSLPFHSIDDLVRHDFLKEGKDQGSVFLYLINLGPQSKPYAYSYSPGDSSPGNTKCLGSIWTASHRYVWVDLAAGPLDYGPALSGEGLMPRGDFHPLASLHGRPKSHKALLADLASLVSSAYQVLLVPSLRIPVSFENVLVVQFVHVYGSESNDRDRDSYGLDWKAIEKTFMDEAEGGGLLLPGQELRFKSYEVKYSDCMICSFAVSRSVNSYTSRFLFDNYTLIVSEYLDSKRLHQILSDSGDELRRMTGLPEEEAGRTIPVYVFDLDYNTLLLLDRYHQSVAFKDMVIAVRTRSTQTVSDYSCNGRHVFTQTRELQRPIVGSILQSMWGVTPTHLMWSPRHNSTLVDYTWSVGQTPFGPFSEVSSLSFVQKDAARRNVILTSLNYSIGSAIDVLESIAAHGGDRKLIKDSQHSELIQRWNLFKYKIDKTVSALSHYDFGMAMYYLRSSDHDLYAMHSIVYQASQELEASLVCFTDPPLPWASVSVSAVCVFALCYAFAQRDKLFRNKRKQF